MDHVVVQVEFLDLGISREHILGDPCYGIARDGHFGQHRAVEKQVIGQISQAGFVEIHGGEVCASWKAEQNRS